jgi:hypothetical protein
MGGNSVHCVQGQKVIHARIACPTPLPFLEVHCLHTLPIGGQVALKTRDAAALGLYEDEIVLNVLHLGIQCALPLT